MKNNKILFLTLMLAAFVLAGPLFASNFADMRNDISKTVQKQVKEKEYTKEELIDILVKMGVEENSTNRFLQWGTIRSEPNIEKSPFLTFYMDNVLHHPKVGEISYKVLADLIDKDALTATVALHFVVVKNRRMQIRKSFSLLEMLFGKTSYDGYVPGYIGVFLDPYNGFIKDILPYNFNAYVIIAAYDKYVQESNCREIKEGAGRYIPVLYAMNKILSRIKESGYKYPYKFLKVPTPITKTPAEADSTDNILKYWAKLYAGQSSMGQRFRECDAYLELPKMLTEYWGDEPDEEIQYIIKNAHPSKKVRKIFQLK